MRRRVSVESADAGRLVRKSVVTLFSRPLPLYPFSFIPFFLLFARAEREREDKSRKERKQRERERERRKKGRKEEEAKAEKEKGRGNATKGGENGITSGRGESRVVTGSGRRQCALYIRRAAILQSRCRDYYHGRATRSLGIDLSSNTFFFSILFFLFFFLRSASRDFRHPRPSSLLFSCRFSTLGEFAEAA